MIVTASAMKVNTSMIGGVEKVNLLLKMEIFMKEISKMTNFMDMVY